MPGFGESAADDVPGGVEPEVKLSQKGSPREREKKESDESATSIRKVRLLSCGNHEGAGKWEKDRAAPQRKQQSWNASMGRMTGGLELGPI